MTLKIITSEGSLDNLQRLGNPAFKADVGFVQGGVTNGATDKLVSLGSISYQPLLVFYHCQRTVKTSQGGSNENQPL